MTSHSYVETLPLHGSAHPVHPDWRRAIDAVRHLVKDADSTYYAFEVAQALDPNAVERALGDMLRHEAGRRLYAERPCLLDAARDRDALAAMGDGSFGCAYLAHLDRFGLDPVKLIELEREYRPDYVSRSEGLAWFSERLALMHDFWHVLTGYGADGMGEAILLPFTAAQRGGRSNWLLTIGAATQVHMWPRRLWPLELVRAYRRGRRAALLTALPYEELLPEPLAAVRASVGLAEMTAAHPGRWGREHAAFVSAAP